MAGKETPEADVFWTIVSTTKLCLLYGEEAVLPSSRYLIDWEYIRNHEGYIGDTPETYTETKRRALEEAPFGDGFYIIGTEKFSAGTGPGGATEYYKHLWGLNGDEEAGRP